MFRRAATAAAALALALAGAACSGPDALEAQQLLEQAHAAQEQLSSATYEATLSVAAAGQRMSFTMSGGAYLKGPHKGDQYLSFTGEGLPTSFEAQFVQQHGRALLWMNGAWQSVQMPAGSSASHGSFGSLASFDFGKYVKDVHVKDGPTIDGESTSAVTGVIDTAELLSSLAKLSNVTQATGQKLPDTSQLSRYVRDIHAVLFVSDRTSLVRGAVITTSIAAQGQQADLKLVYRLTSVNQPVAIPQPS